VRFGAEQGTEGPAAHTPFSLDATLTGTWSGDDGAIMYVTQSGDDV
jgi:hypothetical protein